MLKIHPEFAMVYICLYRLPHEHSHGLPLWKPPTPAISSCSRESFQTAKVQNAVKPMTKTLRKTHPAASITPCSAEPHMTPGYFTTLPEQRRPGDQIRSLRFEMSKIFPFPVVFPFPGSLAKTGTNLLQRKRPLKTYEKGCRRFGQNYA